MVIWILTQSYSIIAIPMHPNILFILENVIPKRPYSSFFNNKLSAESLGHDMNELVWPAIEVCRTCIVWVFK